MLEIQEASATTRHGRSHAPPFTPIAIGIEPPYFHPGAGWRWTNLPPPRPAAGRDVAGFWDGDLPTGGMTAAANGDLALSLPVGARQKIRPHRMPRAL